MIARLVEANYWVNREHPTTEQVSFWLREMRTPGLLVEIARAHPDATRESARTRRLLEHASSGDLPWLEEALLEEQRAERDADRVYWQPLKQELEKIRTRSQPRGDMPIA